jgi:anti-sigma regulatory factor (Ser/Thr protein kinase)
MREVIALPVTDSSQVGEARRTAAAIVRRLEFDETDAGKVAVIVTEAANNLVKHARDGEILLQVVEQQRTAGIELLILDKGPGMDPTHCLRDGYSTTGTPGTGLGAIVRLSPFFDLHSSPSGTALLVRLWSGSVSPKEAGTGLQRGAISLPKAGETMCGDAWAVEQSSGRHLFLVADGLGHGPQAAAAAREAVRLFRDNVRLEPAQILHVIHAGLRSTRGAAVAIAAVDFGAQKVHYVGVGNIAGTVASPSGTASMVSHNGTLGYQVHKVQEFIYPFPRGALLVLHSDGLTSHWRLDSYPGLVGRDPSLVAGVLYRDFKRGRDDVTVLVARDGGKDSSPA